MSRAMFRRLQRIEERIEDSKPPERGIVCMPGQEPPEGFRGPVVHVEIVEGRRSVPVYEGERLAPDAWPRTLLVPTPGKRPEGEPLPYCLAAE